MRLEYGLVENALDSLRESMAYYTEGDETHNVNQYKFSILLAAHCAELLLKEILRRNHPALLFENINSVEQTLRIIVRYMLPTEIVLHKKPFFENLVAENTFFGQGFSHVQNVKIILLSICQMVHGCVLYAVLESRKLCIATSAETKSLTQIGYIRQPFQTPMPTISDFCALIVQRDIQKRNSSWVMPLNKVCRQDRREICLW